MRNSKKQHRHAQSSAAMEVPPAAPDDAPTHTNVRPKLRSLPRAASPLASWAAALQPFTWADAVVFAIVALTCGLLFQQRGDIGHTLGCTFSLLNGHWLDFYEVNTKLFGPVNYLPSTYIVYAIWGLPLYLLNLLPSPGQPIGYCVFWFKLLNVILYLSSAFALFKVCQGAGLEKSRAKMAAAAWMSGPLTIFSVLIFGQYDIMTTCAFLIALHFYFKNQLLPFAAITGLALTFKYMPIVVFIPLLLLKEKNIWKLALYTSVALVPACLEMLPFLSSEAFRKGVFGFQVAHRSYGMMLENGLTSFSINPLVWFVLCGLAYLKEPASNQERSTWAMYYALFAAGSLFLLIFWHPQWLLFMTPFMALAACAHQRPRFWYAVDVGMMAAFVPYTVGIFHDNVDTFLWGAGVLGRLRPNVEVAGKSFLMKNVPWLDLKPEITLSVLYAGIVLYLICMAPRAASLAWRPLVGAPSNEELWAARLRCLVGVALWVVPAAYAYNLTPQ